MKVIFVEQTPMRVTFDSLAIGQCFIHDLQEEAFMKISTHSALILRTGVCRKTPFHLELIVTPVKLESITISYC